MGLDRTGWALTTADAVDSAAVGVARPWRDASRCVAVCRDARKACCGQERGCRREVWRAWMQDDAGQGGRRDLLKVPGDGLDAELGLEEGEERVRALAVDLNLAEERKLGLHTQPPMSSCSPARHPWSASHHLVFLRDKLLYLGVGTWLLPWTESGTQWAASLHQCGVCGACL